MFKLDIEKEEIKHKKTLSHYLEKIHRSTGYHNKEVAEILDMDKSYYNKIRLQQISPLTNSIVILKKFASLNNMSVIDFIAQIEEIPSEIKENDWVSTLRQVMTDMGPILRRSLIHQRLSTLVKSNHDYSETILKCFVSTVMLMDLHKNPKWLDTCVDMISKIHSNLNLEKNDDLINLLARVKIKNKD